MDLRAISGAWKTLYHAISMPLFGASLVEEASRFNQNAPIRRGVNLLGAWRLDKPKAREPVWSASRRICAIQSDSYEKHSELCPQLLRKRRILGSTLFEGNKYRLSTGLTPKEYRYLRVLLTPAPIA